MSEHGTDFCKRIVPVGLRGVLEAHSAVGAYPMVECGHGAMQLWGPDLIVVGTDPLWRLFQGCQKIPEKDQSGSVILSLTTMCGLEQQLQMALLLQRHHCRSGHVVGKLVPDGIDDPVLELLGFE